MILTFQEYYQKLLERQNLSEVKYNILKTLWDSGDNFPKEWIKSSELLEITNQKYFDRRARELKDELGCDIETDSRRWI